ncbi:unnamed protein product [Rodentolepis nana]|uniref:UBC core domain-containing protein n=1 Tax=Rodentolepis nana TaxID=102285 RepID=A0A0R3TC35_RODNA|nr:unnamed protein product [Rodentolepis nana]
MNPPIGYFAAPINDDLLVSIISLMSDPNPDDPLVHEIAEVFNSDREQFDKTAKEWTEKFAT